MISELYKQVESVKGWEAVAILTGDNELANCLHRILGDYTATPFDNGQIVINSAKGKYGLLRGRAAVRGQKGTIYSLLKDEVLA